MNVGEIEYTVSVETQQSINAAQQFDKQMDQAQDSARKTDRELGKLDTGFSKLATAIKGVIAVSALRSMAGMVQEYQAMAERVKMATRSTEEFETVQKRLQTTADGTYRSLAEAQELYIRTADSIRSMGYTLEETIDIQDSMSYAFVTNATSADRAQAAINQFTKAVNTGRVSADQWETVSSAIPTIINDIAAASGKSASEVRALGAAGKLAARELTEGLRKSLDETRAASDNMATDLIDASVRAKNAITTVLVGLENQTGAIQAVTDGIIAASEAMLEFGQDAEKMESFLKLATVAGASLAAVMAGRMLTAMVAYTAGQVAALQATIAKTGADKAAAGALVRRTVVEKEAARTAMIAAQADFNAAKGSGAHATALNNLTAAKSRYMAATTAAAAAQSAANRVMTLGTIAANGLRTAMAFLGGPAGVAMLAALAIYTFASASREAAPPTDDLTKSVKELSAAQRELAALEATRRLDELGEKARVLADNLKYAEGETGRASKRSQRYAEDVLRMRVEQEKLNDEIGVYRKRLEDLQSYQTPDAPTGEGTGEPPASTSSKAGQDAIKSLNDQLEATKLLGVARARLTALQKLGADATDEERAEVARLVTEIYNLEESQKAATKATEDSAAAAKKAAEEQASGIEQNADTIAALEEQMRQAEMSAGELAQRQAELSLNEYATPQQIARIKELGAALRENAEEEDREKMQKAAVAADPRTEAANQYAEQLAAYQQYKEQELLTDQQYNELKNAAATEYEQARLAAQEEMFRAQSAGNDFLMGSIDALGNASTNVISGLLSGTMNTQEAMQALGNAIFQHAIGALVDMGVQQVKSLIMGQTAQAAAAAAAVATGGAVASAWAPAAAAVSLATLGANSGPAMAGITATYGATSAMSVVGARRQGGPVAAGSMYRVNEGGAPEIFQNNLGQQYMIPNSRGEVVSNKDASKGGGGNVFNVTISVEGAMSSEQARQQGFEISESFVQGVRSVIGGELQAGGSIWQAVR